MITKIKIYEKYNKDPQIGDYVICKEMPVPNQQEEIDVTDFTDNNIGQYIKHISNNQGYEYLIKYENVPEEYEEYITWNDKDHNKIPDCRAMNRNEIIHFSPNKKILEPFLTSNKYNL